MEKYIGVKEIKATPMTRGKYNTYRGWEIPADEDPGDDGFLVEYLDGGQANHPDHAGYISWSPAGVFERAYRRVDGLTFGQAIEAMKAGKKVSRAGWNGKGMWLRVVYPYMDKQFLVMEGEFCEGTLLPYIGMKTADNGFVPWLASQTDVLSEDWSIVD